MKVYGVIKVKRNSKFFLYFFAVGMALNFVSCIHDADVHNYTVSYVTEYGDAPQSFTVEENTVLTKEQLPEMKEEGFRFEGWYDGAIEVKAGLYKVTKDVVLTAKWEEIKPIMYKVTYVTEYGEAPQTFTVEENTVLIMEQLPKLNRSGYFFAGWYDGEKKVIADKYRVTHDVVLIAKWKIPVELKDCEFINSLFEQASGGLDKPTRFIKSKKKPENANYYLDRFNRDVSLWYDENSSTLYYYIDEGKALGLYCASSDNLMFSYMSSLEYIDTSDFDTSNVKSMSNMFLDCCSLTELDLSSFDTESVTNMFQMFLGCTSLTGLDLRSFDTGNVVIMAGMFCACSSLKELDLSSFETGKVTDMTCMFEACSSMTEFDLSSFNTSQVVYMHRMFDNCRTLQELDLSIFNTKNVVDIGSMFADCLNILCIDLRSFETNSVIRMDSMFRYCTSLSKIITSEKFLTGKVEVSDDMFVGCKSLVGGKGTTYDSKKIDKEYARIDKGMDNPGYFTAID